MNLQDALKSLGPAMKQDKMKPKVVNLGSKKMKMKKDKVK